MKRAWVAALLGICLSTSAQAYVREHVDATDPSTPCLFWNRRSVPFQVSSRGSVHAGTDPAFASLRASFAAWSNVTCSDFAYQDNGLTQATQVGVNRDLLNQPFLAGDLTPENEVIFRAQSCDSIVPNSDPCLEAANDDCSSVYDCWPYGDSVIALTTLDYDSETGSIFAGNVELNDFAYAFTTADPPAPLCDGGADALADGGPCIGADIENTVTHEAGHLLGLAHSLDPNATMYYSAPPGQTSKRILSDDDISGICAIYPSGQATVTCNEPAAASGGCSCGRVDGGAFGLVVLAGMGWRRRRRGLLSVP